MSLGGVRGGAVGWGGPFLRRLPHLELFKMGTTRWAVAGLGTILQAQGATT